MPNHVKNRIAIKADAQTAKAIVQEFSTDYPRTPSKSFSDDLVYKKAGAEYDYGWLNEKTNVFTRRDEADVVGVPSGYEQKFEDAWTRFPDFEKIVKSPLEDVERNGDLKPLDNQFSAHDKMKEHLDKFREMQGRDNYQERIENMLKGFKNYLLHGHATWYSWNTANWGTKWNAYTCEKETDNVYTFETAWSAVPELVRIISERNPVVEFVYEYADEDTGANAGAYIFIGGVAQGGAFENQSIAAYNMAFELRPDCKENYKLVDGSYEWIDEDEDDMIVTEGDREMTTNENGQTT